MKALPSLLAAMVLLAALPAGAAEPDTYFPRYTGDEFQALYEHAVAHTLPNLEPAPEQTGITGVDDLDARIWEVALERGYEPRPVAVEDSLVYSDGVLMQPQAAEAWEQLKTEARLSGFQFVVSSAYRSVSGQRSWFLGKLEGTSEAAIDAALRWYSVPGTSKHHGGYALDFRYSDGTFGDFRSTPDYAWLSADNFAIPKKYGFIPSYPDDVADQGPNPEPWEFVWVGVDLIHCGVPLDLSQSAYAASHRWLDSGDVACPGGVTIADLDEMLSTRGVKIWVMLTV